MRRLLACWAVVGQAGACRAPAPASTQVWTVAGTGREGLRGGLALDAQFRSPAALALGLDGRILVGDVGNRRVRSIAGGRVQTIAGDGEAGSRDGPASQARFVWPSGLAVGPDGTVYVADFAAHRIRAIATGQVRTVAGSGEQGFRDGPAAQAQFWHPAGIAVGARGEVYVADSSNHRVRVIADGEVRTLAGSDEGFADGSLAQSQFDDPMGLAIGVDGRLYVGDTGNNRVRLIDGGRVSTLAGSGEEGFRDGPAAQARFKDPLDLAADRAGRVYVADRYNHRIRVIEAGQVVTLAGTGSPGMRDGPARAASFRYPAGIAVASDGRVLVADLGNHRVRVVERSSPSAR